MRSDSHSTATNHRASAVGGVTHTGPCILTAVAAAQMERPRLGGVLSKWLRATQLTGRKHRLARALSSLHYSPEEDCRVT